MSALVRAVPDFPVPASCSATSPRSWPTARAFTTVAVALAALVGEADVVVGVEARGFLLGAAALTAGTGICADPQGGKLPRVAASRSYTLEYGTATLELPAGAVAAGSRVFVVDDVLAMGGTAAARLRPSWARSGPRSSGSR